VTIASSHSGDYLAVGGAFQLYILSGYISGAPISGTATFDSTTLAALGITPGAYTWTWGTGQNADSLTFFAGVQPSSVPEPTSVGLMSVGLAGGALLWARNALARHRPSTIG
jgi:PEP-CTERM motif